ncbi:MAG TPA: response regulator, partial [Spirochaetota bacterium]|nr:response regulator [Spirochaetota bacterium]
MFRQQPHNKAASVLVVDDEDSVRESFSLFLADNNYKVIKAANGQEGFALLSKNNPDIVLCDLYMPQKDGFWFLENVKKYRPDLPVIVISGIGGVKEVVKAIHLGAADYIPKPVEDMSLLTFTLEKVLKEQRLTR